MKKLFVAAMAATAISASAANVAFVKGNEPSTQENGALTYFQDANLGSVISAANLGDLSGYDCLWIHIDRKGLAQGWENLPEEFKGDVAALKAFVNNGGSLYLSGHATQLAVAIDRTNNTPNVFGSGDGANGNDKWLVSAQIANNNTANHPIYAGMQSLKGEVKGHECFGLLWGGEDGVKNILREDHNCLWDGIDVAAFENSNSAKVLGAWGDCNEENCKNAGIVEFYPLSKGKGTVMVNGLAACQWVVENGENAYADNLKKLTSNILNYLTSEDRVKPNDNVVLPSDIPFELPNSNGNVAMLVNSDLYDSLTTVEKQAVDLFKRLFPDADVLYNEFSDLSKYDCVWVNIEKEQKIENLDQLNLDESFVEALWDYLANDGNIYLSKHACFLTTNFFGAQPSINGFGEAKADSDWYMNITSHIDWTHHTIFHGIETVDNGYGQLIPMIGGGAKLYDTNCMWDIPTGDHNNWCAEHNARILGTWGHAADAKHGVGMIEFMRPDAAAAAAGEATKEMADVRKGIVIANGIAANQFASLNETANKYQDNIDKLTKNIISYLSPMVNDNNTSTSVNMVKVADTEAVYYNLQGVRVANPVNGLFIKVQNGKSSKVALK